MKLSTKQQFDLSSCVGEKTGLSNCGEEYRLIIKSDDDCTLVQILNFWTLSIVLSLSKTPSCLCFKTQRFGDGILSPSSGKTYSIGPNR
jgi:hypothetical protein